MNGYPDSVMERYESWKAENQDVYGEFIYMARRLKAQGRKRCSARHLIEVIRWRKGDGKTEEFKINSDYVPIMARELVENFPEFDGFFETRKVRSRGIKSGEQRKREALV
jgi:hypothetical protein